MIDDPEVEAVAIATPTATHFSLARRALVRDKHVLVEKPMCASVAEARELVALAEDNGVTLMVEHTYLFHGAVGKLRQLHQNGSLGAVSYYDSLRVNLGLFQPDLNVLWDLGPHDFSIMDHLFDEDPLHVEATGYCHVNPHLPDIAYVTVHFAFNTIAHFNLSWMSPVKVLRIAIGGSKRMTVWDDLNREEKLKIYDSGISFQQEEQRSHIMPSYRIGDIYAPRVSDCEPLAEVVAHFGKVITGRERSIMTAARGCGSSICSSGRNPRSTPVCGRPRCGEPPNDPPLPGHRRGRVHRPATWSTISWPRTGRSPSLTISRYGC